jgi:hypothetical protein
MNFKEYINLQLQLRESWLVHNNIGGITRLVAVPESKTLFTSLEFQTDEGEMQINFRSLAGEAVAGSGVGFQPKYLVIDTLTAPENNLEKQVIALIQNKFGKLFLKYSFDASNDPFQKMMQQGMQQAGLDKLPPSIQVKQRGQVIGILHSDSINFMVERIWQEVEKFLKPLVDNGLVDYLIIRGGMINKAHYNPKYQQNVAAAVQDENATIGYFKYVANLILNNKFPNVREMFSKTMDYWHPKVQPSSNRVDLQRSEIIKTQVLSHLEGMVRYIAEAILKFDDKKLVKAEALLAVAKANKLHDNVLYEPLVVDMLENDEDLLQWDKVWYQLPKWFLDKNFAKAMESAGIKIYDKIKDMLRDKVIEFFHGGGNKNEMPWDLIWENYKELDLPEDVNKFIEQYLEDKRQATEESKKEREQETTRQSYHVGDEEYKWMTIGSNRWRDVPSKYLDYVSNGKYELKIGDFVKNDNEVGIDTEGVWEDAYERAREEAEGNLKERPSVNYGNDKTEVEEDIDHYWDDFVSDEEIEEVDENTSPDDAVNLIKSKYYDEFLTWRKSKMEEDENQNSWEYEVDEEDSDFKELMWKYEDEIIEEMAFENGLILLIRNSIEDPIEIWLHSKFIPQMMPIIKKMCEINLIDRDKEFDGPLWKSSTRVRLWQTDKSKAITKTAYEWVTTK